MSEFTYVTDDAGFTWYFYGKGLKKIHVPAGAYNIVNDIINFTLNF